MIVHTPNAARERILHSSIKISSYDEGLINNGDTHGELRYDSAGGKEDGSKSLKLGLTGGAPIFQRAGRTVTPETAPQCM